MFNITDTAYNTITRIRNIYIFILYIYSINILEASILEAKMKKNKIWCTKISIETYFILLTYKRLETE